MILIRSEIFKINNTSAKIRISKFQNDKKVLVLNSCAHKIVNLIRLIYKMYFHPNASSDKIQKVTKTIGVFPFLFNVFQLDHIKLKTFVGPTYDHSRDFLIGPSKRCADEQTSCL